MGVYSGPALWADEDSLCSALGLVAYGSGDGRVVVAVLGRGRAGVCFVGVEWLI